MQAKICSKCKKLKALSEFYKNRQKFDGLRPDCKQCNILGVKKYQQSHKTKTKKDQKKYRETHREESRAYAKEYAKKHPEKSGRRGYILRAEKLLGKPLPAQAEIHHHNKTQLGMCENPKYHMLLHIRMRALKACGNLDWRRCYYWKRYDSPVNLYIKSNGNAYHKLCHNQYNQKWREKNA